MRLAWGLFTGAVGVAWSFLPGSPALAQGDTSPSLLAPVAAGGETATRTASAVNTGRSRRVQTHAGLLTGLDPGRGTRVHLPLFDDATFDVVVDRTAVMGVGTQAWYGRLVGVPLGTVTMVVHQGLFAAAIHAGGRGTFDVLPRPDGTGVVRELVADDLPSCGGALTDGAAPSAARSADAATDKPQAGSGGVETSFVPSLPVCDDGTVIDLLVVYTQDALAAAGDVATMNARINLAVADTNDAFVRSLINTSVRLVHTQQVLYTESGDADIDAPRLVNPSDGYLDDVHPLRDQYGADCVSLWVKTFSAGGIGYFPHPSWTGVGASGFTIVRQDTAGGLVLAHELGHNLWCAHDRANAPDPPFAEYSYGYREPGGAWHDIMAYPPGFLIPYFANPDVNYPGPINPGPTGVPVGDPLPCDIALTSNETRSCVAILRSPGGAGRPAVLHGRSSAPSGGDGLSWATAFNDIQRALCRAGGS
ncbi:MAG: hypothetical protein HY718_21680, partial [Planctomycetes bacterium]|nr:hypothetical protein [Planctomycetota bacterium]